MKQDYSTLLGSNVLWQQVIMSETSGTQYPMYLRRGLGNAMGANGNVY